MFKNILTTKHPHSSQNQPHYSLEKKFPAQVVAINLFGLVVIGGDKAFHVLSVKQIEEQDNCSKQVQERSPGTQTLLESK